MFSETSWNVSDREAVNQVVNRLVDTYRDFDVLANSVGRNRLEPLVEMSQQTWATIISINLTETFTCVRAVAPSIAAHGSGAIVNVCSAAAWESTMEDGSPTPASDGGMLRLAFAAASARGPHGVRINAVAAGLIYNHVLRRIDLEVLRRGTIADRDCRFGLPGDAATLVSFHASARASYIAGEA